MGSRTKMLFVEGMDGSLDIELYRIVFSSENDIDVVPRGGYPAVESSVRAIRGSEALYWMEAFGIVDRDGRADDEVTALRKTGVYPLDVYSVESIYYHPLIQREVAKHFDESPEDKVTAARAAAIEEIAKQREGLVARALERMVRRAILERIPGREAISAEQSVRIEIDKTDLPQDPRADLERAIDDGDLEYIMKHYPIKPGNVRGVIARQLGFTNRTEYERSVRKVLRDRPQALEFVRSLLGGLASDITASGS